MLSHFSLFLSFFPSSSRGCGFSFSSRCSTTRYAVSLSLCLRVLSDSQTSASLRKERRRKETSELSSFCRRRSKRRLHQRRRSLPLSLSRARAPLFLHFQKQKQVIWQVVNHGHCTFKVKTLKQVRRKEEEMAFEREKALDMQS